MSVVADDRPVWRQGFDAVEQAVGPRLTELINSEPFAIGVGIVTRVQRSTQARTERTTRRLLHLANLPAGSDVTRLLAEIGRLQSQVRDLSKQLGTMKESGADDGPTGNVGSARPRQARR